MDWIAFWIMEQMAELAEVITEKGRLTFYYWKCLSGCGNWVSVYLTGLK